MANFIDMGHHRVVTRDQTVGFIEHFDRMNETDTTNTQHNTSTTAAEIRYAESSMRNGFGLKLLHKFLNVPYLMLQRETLLTQLALNQRENALRPFHRLETSRNKETGGTGLGLGIATNIILSHGGTLELLESPMKGLRVKLTLPI